MKQPDMTRVGFDLPRDPMQLSWTRDVLRPLTVFTMFAGLIWLL